MADCDGSSVQTEHCVGRGRELFALWALFFFFSPSSLLKSKWRKGAVTQRATAADCSTHQTGPPGGTLDIAFHSS